MSASSLYANFAPSPGVGLGWTETSGGSAVAAVTAVQFGDGLVWIARAAIAFLYFLR